MRYDDVFALVGGTPCVRVPAPEVEQARIWLKLESMNPSGSVKDRAAVSILRAALDDGSLRPGKVLLDASSGNFACAVAYYGRQLGYDALLVSSSKLTEDKASFIRYYGAELHKTGDFTIEGNRWCRELVEREGPESRYCFLDQLHNWANPEAHYRSTGPEILADFPEVAMIVASLGSGGTLCGTGRFFKQRRPQTRIVAIEAASGTRLPGTGAFDDGDYVTPFIEKGFAAGWFDHRQQIRLEEATAWTLRMRDLGLYCGIQAGGVLHGTVQAVRDLGVEGDVVAVAGDAGWKNMDKLTPLVEGTRTETP